MLVTPKSFSQRLGHQALGRSITAAEEVDAAQARDA